ncbi:hypothetical protein Tco_0198193, partial [Tanacetum coccineum]
YSATNAVKQCNSSASDVLKSTKGNFHSLLNAEKVESFDFVLPKYAVDEVKIGYFLVPKWISRVSYLSSKVERITEATSDNKLIECEGDIIIPCRLATVASGTASGKLLQYELGLATVASTTQAIGI